jgi:hypothetical protein
MANNPNILGVHLAEVDRWASFSLAEELVENRGRTEQQRHAMIDTLTALATRHLGNAPEDSLYSKTLTAVLITRAAEHLGLTVSGEIQ